MNAPKNPAAVALGRLGGLKGEKHHVTMIWVKGHNGHDQNERCDKMANFSATIGPFHTDIVFEKLKKS